MSRDHLTRMDADTRWLYTDHARRLQTKHPEAWPAYWCAYQAVLAESWWEGRRVPLESAWTPLIPGSMEDALAALQDAKLLDARGKVVTSAWKKWFEPARDRIERRSTAGVAGAKERWIKHAERIAEAAGGAMRSHSSAVHQASHPSQPSKPSKPASGTRALDTLQDVSSIVPVAGDNQVMPTALNEPWKTFEELTGTPMTFVSVRTSDRIDGLVLRRDVQPVVEAMRAVASSIAQQPPAPEQLVTAVQKHLEPIGTTRTKGANPTTKEARDAFRS